MDADVKTEGSDKRLNDLVAVTVVILSVFMAVSNIKDDNINQAMQKAKSESVDAWAEYQVARVKLHIDENGLAQLRLLETAGNFDRTLGRQAGGRIRGRHQEIRRAIEGDARQGGDAWRQNTTGSISATTSSTCRTRSRRSLSRWRRWLRWSTVLRCSMSPGVAAPSACFSALRALLGLNFRPEWLAQLLGT